MSTELDMMTCHHTVLTSLIQAHDVISKISAPGGCHDFNSSQVFADLDTDLTHLQRQLTSGHHDKSWGITNRFYLFLDLSEFR